MPVFQPHLFFPFYCPVLESGGRRKTNVQKWPIHQTPSLHSLISIHYKIHCFLWASKQDSEYYDKRTVIAQGIFFFCINRQKTGLHKITHPSISPHSRHIHINNKKDKTRYPFHSTASFCSRVLIFPHY